MLKLLLNTLKTLKRALTKVVIGLILGSQIMFLTACGSNVIVVNREPIKCIETMKTNGDMAKCLLEYKEKYK